MTGPARRRKAERKELYDLARMTFHDVNNLLIVIETCASMILERRADPATAEDAGEIRAAAARAGALVRETLGGASPPPVQPISLNPAIEGLAGLLRRLLGERIGLVLDLGAEGPRARIDPMGIERVLVNLAVNARNAMPEGGTLSLRSGAAEGSAWIEVADTGSGIAPEILPQLFEAGATTRRGRGGPKGGYGLGLASVQEIVRAAGGTVGVESEAGRGTVFRIALPGAEAASIRHQPIHHQPTHHRKVRPGLRALLVEDETAVARVAALALKKEGWEVELAPSGEAVIGTVEERARPDVLVTDLALPGMDGPALVRKLRARWPGLPAILVSGYDDEPARRALAAEAMRFLAKPYSMDGLAAAMAEAVAEATEAAGDGEGAVS